MGLFDKLKNILFEDEEIDDLPDYSKEEVKEQPITRRERSVSPEIMVEPVKEESEPVVENRFKNVKRDIDLSYDDDDIFKELNKEPVKEVKEEVKPPVPEIHVEPKREERRSVFQSFDEDEFERLNSRITNNENRSRAQEAAKKEIPAAPTSPVTNNMSPARRANNNFSATTPNRDIDRDPNRYKIEEPHGKKPFRPSPVISPVYGILDKNYSKDDIVDKKDGIKRERIKPIITHTQDIPSRLDEEVEVEEVSVDTVRRKAYGVIPDVHHEIDVEAVAQEEARRKEIDSIVNDMRENDLTMEDIPKMNKTVEDLEEINAILEEEPKVEETPVTPVVEEVVEEEIPSFDISNLVVDMPSTTTEEVVEEPETTNNIEDEIDIEINDIPEVKDYHEEEDDIFDKSHILDDMEKTSTLQILDDIEKELNSIKPINRYDEDDDDDQELDEKARLDRSDTLENDLFNLIDSMYEEGEEDDDNDNA